MKYATSLLVLAAVAFPSFGMADQSVARPVAPPPLLFRHLIMEAAYVRETRDQEWHCRIAGSLPTPPGLYLVIYNERGDIVFRGEVPAGTHPPEAPFSATVPADATAQQYVVLLIGCNQNASGVTLPMTDLPYEVYGGKAGNRYWVMHYPARGEVRRLAFKVNPGAKDVSFEVGDQVVSILDDAGALVADNRGTNTAPDATKNPVPLPLNLKAEPGRTYWLDPGNCSQFGVSKDSEKIFFTFDPERWFAPALSWDLESRPWWKGLFTK